MAEDSRIAQTSSADVTNTRRLDKIAAPHVDHGPSQVGPWTGLATSPLGKDLRPPFVRFSISFCFTSRPFASHPTSSLFTLDFYQQTSPHLCRPRPRCRAPYSDLVKRLHAGYRCSSSNVAARVYCRQYHLHVRLFIFPPVAHFVRGILVFRCLRLT